MKHNMTITITMQACHFVRYAKHAHENVNEIARHCLIRDARTMCESLFDFVEDAYIAQRTKMTMREKNHMDNIIASSCKKIDALL